MFFLFHFQSLALGSEVWELEIVFFLFYFQSLALGSKWSQIRKTIFIVLIKSFTVNEYIPIANERQLFVSSLKKVTYRFIGLVRVGLYSIYYGRPTTLMMQIFFLLCLLMVL